MENTVRKLDMDPQQVSASFSYVAGLLDINRAVLRPEASTRIIIIWTWLLNAVEIHWKPTGTKPNTNNPGDKRKPPQWFRCGYLRLSCLSPGSVSAWPPRIKLVI